MIVKHKFIGLNTKGSEVFGDLGNSGFSKKHGFFQILLNEIVIRTNNKQNIFAISYMVIGRIIIKSLNFLLHREK